MEAAQKLARTESPQTSKDAAEKMIKSGILNLQEQLVLGAISDYLYWDYGIDFTVKDIPKAMRYYPYDKAYDICRKRFSDLQMKGKIELVKEKKNITDCTFIYVNKRRDGCRVWRLK